MFQGDHLQLLYNYWIFADMLAGQTPWFHNVYEFNTGDDAARRQGGSYNVPFSLVFAAGYAVGGRAFGWNLAAFFSLWITHLFTWWLLRNYTRRDAVAAWMALIAVALPYRWAMQLGGSPAGPAMAWVPFLLLGLEALFRRSSIRGGCVAALAILFSWWNDSHVFLFNVLLLPAWSLLVLVQRERPLWRERREWARLAVALLPLAMVTGAVVLASLIELRAAAAATNIGTGRTWREIALFSPRPAGLLAWRAAGNDNAAYVGYVAPVLIAVGLLVQLARFRRAPRAEWRATVVMLMLVAGMLLLVALALGAYGPGEGRLFAIARKLVPPLNKVRQPAKLLILLPPLLAVGAAFALDRILNLWRGRFAPGLRGANWGEGLWPAVVVALLFLIEYDFQVRPTICLLDTQQAAYAAVAADAARAGRVPRAVIVPLWPGDSSWASLYEHYVSLYRIRMLNGYRPVVARDYITNVFERFGYINLGELPDDRLDELRARGFDYIILHEDAFPEKVSPFPVAFTLRRLLEHPRLDLLRQAENVWAFKIRDQPVEKATPVGDWNVFFPGGPYELDTPLPADCVVAGDATATGDRYARLTPEAGALPLRKMIHWNAPDPALLFRARGHGELKIKFLYDSGAVATQWLELATDRWDWRRVDLPAPVSGRWVTIQAACKTGAVDLDAMIYVSGALPDLAPGAGCRLPAPLFYHAGYTDLAGHGVCFRSRNEPDAGIFYGPRLPLPAGRYQLELEYESPAPAGTVLGRLALDGGRSVPVAAGGAAVLEYTALAGDPPLNLVFSYTRAADMVIRGVTITRIE